MTNGDSDPLPEAGSSTQNSTTAPGTVLNMYGQLHVTAADASVAVTSALDRFNHRTSESDISVFDGRNAPLKVFVQDVMRAGIFITNATEPEFIRAVLSRLKGQAWECFSSLF